MERGANARRAILVPRREIVPVMRFVILTAVMVVVLSACGGHSASDHHPLVSSNLPTPTSTPQATAAPENQGAVLLDVKGAQEDTTTRAFTAGSAWKAHYSFKCMMVDPKYGHGVLQIYGIDPKHPNGQETIIVYALTSSARKATTGISERMSAGAYKLRILGDPVCSWHVVVRTA